MRNNEFQISGSGGRFQIGQRRRSTRLFSVSAERSYFITLSQSLWDVFDYLKIEDDMTDAQLLLEHSDLADKWHQKEGSNYAENLQILTEGMLQYRRNEYHQNRYGTVPVNCDSLHGQFSEKDSFLVR